MPLSTFETKLTCRSGFPEPSARWALFLDFDGTLVEIAARPQDVVVPCALIDTLRALVAAFDGAVALVSGRPIADIDRLIAPLQMPAAGQHGLEWRITPDGALTHHGGDPSLLDGLRRRFDALTRQYPDIDIEDKIWSLSVHYRAAPQAGPAIITMATEHLPPGDHLHMIHGKMVVEIKPAGIDKGQVVNHFLAEPPFAGRVPVFIGDDRTDEDGFAAVNSQGGVSVRVGPPPSSVAKTCARWQCTDVADLADWLASLPHTI